MDLYSVYVPKLLPKTEPFSSKIHSCPGCGQAVAVRLIGKAMEDHKKYQYGTTGIEIHSATLPYKNWEFYPSKKSERSSQKIDEKKVLAVAGESGTFDDGLKMLIEARDKKRPFLYVCFINESGIERHKDVASKGYRPNPTKNFIQRFRDSQSIIEKAKAVKPDFMATACPSYSFDLIEKIKKALDCTGISFIAVFVTCPTGCFYDPSLSLRSGKLAVETGFFPLYRIEGGTVSAKVHTQCVPPLTEYMKLQPAFTVTSPDELKKIQDEVNRVTEKL